MASRDPAVAVPMRREQHFGNRVVHCFGERPRSVTEVFERARAARGEAEAVVCGALRLRYAELGAQADRVAAGLRARGIGPGDRVALWLGNRIEFIVALIAVLRLGAIAVPLSTRLQTPEVAFILHQCSAAMLLHECELAARVPEAADVPALRHRVVVGEPVVDAANGFDALLGHGCVDAPEAVGEEDTAMILYTSGTTGKPKGAMLTHLNIVHSLLNYQYAMALGPDDRSMLAVPCSHVTGVLALVMTAWQAQGALVVMPDFNARAFLELAARERITHTIIVPAMYNLCLLQPDFGQYDLGAWRVGGYGGAPMPEATIASFAQRVPGLGLRNVYGSTETSSPVTMMRPELTASRPDSIGFVLPGADILVMDTEGHEVAPGQPGELWIAGPMVVPGYWEHPQATADAFVGGYWRSGDIGSIDAQGFVRVFDRFKDMINRGGYKIYSLEVENVLSHHPG
ncbi:MAG: class I adenylate-forming enzyme family protein, partial [Variovorax sp.]